MFQYDIGDSDLEHVDVINDLGVLVDSKITLVNHIESIISKSAKMLGFIIKGVRPLHVQDVVCGFCPAGFGVCIVRVVTSSEGSFSED
jgi:hypothetical protein